MATFDDHVRRVAEYVEELRGKGRPTREFFCPSSVEALVEGLPVRVGPGANPGIILRADAFAEFGSPDMGSCACIMWAAAPSLVRDGAITLIGADVQEAAGASLPFGQVLLVWGKDLKADEYQSLVQTQYIADQIEGYMLKSSSRNMWARVSKDAAAKGFCFETLGRSLIGIFKSTLPKIEAMEVVFVTSSKEDVRQLDGIAAQVREIGREIVKESWKAKGFDLDCDFDCSSCRDKQVCDEIREVIAARNKKEAGEAAADRAS